MIIQQSKITEKLKFEFEKYTDISTISPFTDKPLSMKNQMVGAKELQKAPTLAHLPVYQLGLNDIESRLPLSSFEPKSWLAPLSSDQHKSLVVELDAKDGELQALAEAPYLKSLMAEVEGVSKGKAENTVLIPALIQVKALYVTALWLKPQNSSDQSIIIPVGVNFPPLESKKHYTEDEFLAVVNSMANSYRKSTPNTII